MPRTWITGATIALLATPALAAPGFGSSSWTVSSESGSARADTGEPSVLMTLLGFLNINIEKNASGPTTDRTSEPRVTKPECPDAKAANAEKAANANKQNQAGPEPVYLAF